MAGNRKTIRNTVPPEHENRRRYSQGVRSVRRPGAHAEGSAAAVQASLLSSFHPGGREYFLHTLNDPLCETVGWRTLR
jgi:hypothetical protein